MAAGLTDYTPSRWPVPTIGGHAGGEGVANISTTSTYVKTNRVTLQKAAKRFNRQRNLCKAIANSLPSASGKASSIHRDTRL